MWTSLNNSKSDLRHQFTHRVEVYNEMQHKAKMKKKCLKAAYCLTLTMAVKHDYLHKPKNVKLTS